MVSLPHLGIDVYDDEIRQKPATHHLTLVHFDELTDEDRKGVFEVMSEIVAMVKNPPVGTYGRQAMMGRYGNVKAVMVNSPYLVFLRGEITKRLEARRVPYSTTFGFTPHVSKPTVAMNEGSKVYFAMWIDLVIHKEVASTFLLG